MHFLDQVGSWFGSSSNWWGSNGIGDRTLAQVEIAAVVIAIASVVGVAVGFALGHFRRGGFLAVNSANAARAVPSLALLTLLVLWPVVSLKDGGFLAAVIALVALGIPPVLTNAYVAMREVDPDVNEAARAMGMSGWRRFVLIEVPLAAPLTVAGIRTAAVEVMATSTLAAYVSFNDLGGFIFAGLATNDAVETFCGALLVAVLSGLVDLAVLALYRLVTPVALRRSGAFAAVSSRGVIRRRPPRVVLEAT